MGLIHDVAKYAGVSVSTVSKALGGEKYQVSDATRKKVLDAVQALGYSPNNLGHNLKNTTKTILVAGFYPIQRILKGIYKAANELNFEMIFMDTRIYNQADYITKIENGSVKGAVFINLLDENMLTRLSGKYPVVQCGEYIDFPKSVSVSINNEKAAYEITDMMIKQGKKRFAFVFSEYLGEYRYNMARERKNGFLHALADNNIEYIPELMRNCPYSDDISPVIEIARSFAALDPDKRPDAIFCEQALVGVVCINTLRLSGVSVPEEVAVAGFDDTSMCAVSDPMLTSVRHPYEDMGKESVHLINSIIEGKLSTGRHVYLDHEIVIRGSTHLNK